MSLRPIGMPCSGPRYLPAAISASVARAEGPTTLLSLHHFPATPASSVLSFRSRAAWQPYRSIGRNGLVTSRTDSPAEETGFEPPVPLATESLPLAGSGMPHEAKR